MEWPERCAIRIASSNARSSSKSEINVNYFCLNEWTLLLALALPIIVVVVQALAAPTTLYFLVFVF